MSAWQITIPDSPKLVHVIGIILVLSINMVSFQYVSAAVPKWWGTTIACTKATIEISSIASISTTTVLIL